jgi:hypothetical protein
VECTATDVTECPVGETVCLNNQCVECTAANATACTGTQPICDTTNVCRACEEGECPMGTECDITGACVAP